MGVIDNINDKLSPKIYQLDVFQGCDAPKSLIAFKFDEVVKEDFNDNLNELNVYKKDNQNKKSIREYMGMAPHWAACDYVLWGYNNDNKPIIFIIEKSDLGVSAIKVKKNDGLYRCINISINKGLKDTFNYPKEVRADASKSILGYLKEKMILKGLVDEYKQKLYSSLLILTRLHNDERLNTLPLRDLEFYFVILDIPLKESKERPGWTAVKQALSDKVLSKFGEVIMKDIENKTFDTKQNGKSMNIRFSGILKGRKALLGYLKTHSKYKYN